MNYTPVSQERNWRVYSVSPVSDVNSPLYNTHQYASSYNSALGGNGNGGSGGVGRDGIDSAAGASGGAYAVKYMDALPSLGLSEVSDVWLDNLKLLLGQHLCEALRK
jgi:hypothetical protein